MPRLVKGGKWTYGWVVIGPEGEITIPPEAWREFGFQAGDEAVFIPGSRRSGGFAISTPELMAVVTTVATLLWLAVTLLYIFDARSVVWFGRIAFLDNDVAKGLGIAVCTIGVLVGIAGEVALGESFRVALPRGETKLVTTGIYRYTRNPCVLGVDLFVLGTFLIAPSLLALLAVVLNLIGYYLKVQAEEEYLLRTHGAEYEAYCARTGRYLPLLLGFSSLEKEEHVGDNSDRR